ncbi:MAG: glycosyltransferase [Candidatus Brocadiaceae bacterium]|nr:glycosyltransferase [Candidatus Brocadiaceae bacterium]
MNILMVHHRIPYPLNSGRDKVSYNLIRALSTVHKVTLIAPVDEFTSKEAVEEVRKICHELVPVAVKNLIFATQKSKILYVSRLIRLFFTRTPMYITDHTYPAVANVVMQYSRKGNYDLFQATSHATAGYFKFARLLRPHILGPMDDMAESIRSQTDVTQDSNIIKCTIMRFMYRASLFYDTKVSIDSDVVFFHSEEDLNRVCRLSGNRIKAMVLPTVVEKDEGSKVFQKNLTLVEKPNSIVFVGGLGSYFNVDAVLFFYKEIWPLILEKLPNAKFYIVGQKPPPEIKSLAETNKVIVTGYVQDVRQYIEKCAVYVSPIQSGTGFKTKIIEALSLGIAIVSTSHGVQGLWDLGNNVIQIKDSPKEFANAVVSLLNNNEKRIDLGKRGRQLFENSYSFKAVTPKILEIYDEIDVFTRLL